MCSIPSQGGAHVACLDAGVREGSVSGVGAAAMQRPGRCAECTYVATCLDGVPAVFGNDSISSAPL